MVRLSLRARLLTGMAVVVMALVTVAVIVTATTRSHLIDQVDQRLEQTERTPGPPTGQPDWWCTRSPGNGPDGPGQSERFSEFFELVFDRSGELVSCRGPNFGRRAGTPVIDLVRASRAADSGDPFTVGSADGNNRFRVVVRSTGDELYVTALPLDDVGETMRRLITMELLVTAAIVAMLGAVTWWVIRLGIRPIKHMTATATAIAGGDLSQRVDTAAAGTEAGELGEALNHMLATQQAAFDERTASRERLQQFVADASHELRTPVTTIRGYAELYRLGALTNVAELDDAMRRTEQEAVRMARLVDDMLTLAKLGASRPLERRPVDLRVLLDDAASDARAVAPERSISVGGDRAVPVVGDVDRLRQVIANVIGNALIHTPDGAAIDTVAVARDGQVVVEITDQGPGMEYDVAARVTERFYRADPGRSRERGGSGLGLSIAEAVIAAHGGTIEVMSEAGRGTTVRLVLPVAPRELPPPPPEARAQADTT